MHSLRDRDLENFLDWKVDLALQEEKEAQQILYQVEPENDGKNFEKHSWTILFHEINPEFDGLICEERELRYSEKIMQEIAN